MFSFLFMLKSQQKVDIKLSKDMSSDLSDSLKQGTTGQLNFYDTCWLLQTVPGFADFAGVVEITRLNTSNFSYLSG